MAKFTEIIPAPKGYWGDGTVNAYEATVSGDFPLETASFAAYAKRILDIDVKACENGAVTIKKCECLAAGEYRLEIGEEAGKITVKVGDSEGLSAAFGTLLQLGENRDGKLLLPTGGVYDRPECKWRGLLIDCARRRHSVPLLKKYVDLCRFYKVKYLHIHFTDDENFTLPSRAFPKITTPENCYSYEEIAELDSYAYENGVSIIPELDTPGHSTAMLKAYPDVFGVEGIIKFTKDAIEATKVLYREVCEMFPHSEYIHMGGDESRLGWWLEEQSLAYGESIGISVKDEISEMTPNEYVMLRFLATFIKEMAETITECGKKPAVWEGFNKVTNDIVPKNVTVMVFDSSYQLAPSLCEAGFEVINCAWFPLYVVIPYWIYTQKNCFDWDVYSFGTINENSPYKNGYMKFDYIPNIEGGQLCSWGDGLKCEYKDPEVGLAKELEEIVSRLPAVAENTWNREKRRSYEAFLIAMEELSEKVKKLLA
ncbi:MAG: family 20 glycosylhydrolase [Clostridia bacterium]|nr:family 20 glycosylhydrolase [Clostridia bacterium]